MPGSRTLRIALIQHAAPKDGPDAALAHLADALAEAAARGTQLAVTQELFTGPYFPQSESEHAFTLAEPIPGPTTDFLSSQARQHSMDIAASLFEQRAPGLCHNSFVMINTHGERVSHYRKMHIPHDPGFREKYYFAPGDGWRVAPLSVGGIRAGMLVCWDQWFPEAARINALRGAHLLLYPTAIGGWGDETRQEREQQREAWITMQRSHAIANGVFVAAVNRVGVEGQINFWGSSFVCDPFGRILDQASPEAEQLLVVDCDLSLIEATRRSWPFFRDRRVDAYGPMLDRWSDANDADAAADADESRGRES